MSCCAICLELLNRNSCNFCCGDYHKNCILKALKTTGKCPICRIQYKSFQNKLIQKDYNNIEQIKLELHEEHQTAILEAINKRLDKLELNYMKILEDNLKKNHIQYKNFR